MNRVLTIIVVLSFLVWIGSCVTRTENLIDEQNTVRLLLDRLSSYNEDVHTINSEALVIYKDGSRTLSFRASIIIDSKSEGMRLNLSDFVFKKPVVSIVKNGDRVITILHRKREYYDLEYSEFDFQQLTGLKIPKEIFVPSLMGKVYMTKVNRAVTPINSYTLTIDTAEFSQNIQFNEAWLPEKIAYRFSSELYTITLNKFSVFRDVSFPQKISVEHRDRYLEISYNEPLVNQKVELQFFQIDERELKDFERAYL